jgi:hypothetical protein
MAVAGHDRTPKLVVRSDFDRNIGILNLNFYIFKKSALLFLILKKMPFYY